MNRRDFFEMTGVTIILPVCLGMLSKCGKTDIVPSAPTNVDFTIDVSTGALAQNGGYLVKNGLIVARTTLGSFLAVSAACTHQGQTLQYIGSKNNFYCSRHGATFDSVGAVTNGPASKALTQYNTHLTGISLRVYS
jgi:cytochrome b6-f complex iron-sulfur subunit